MVNEDETGNRSSGEIEESIGVQTGETRDDTGRGDREPHGERPASTGTHGERSASTESGGERPGSTGTHGERPARTSAVPGILKGLATTARTALRPTHTAEYPDVAPSLPPRSRGVIALLEENCTSCMLCARECPDWCIYIDSHKETIPASTEGGRERQRNVLDRFAIDFSLCMYCGICIEVCPFDALFWSPQFEYAEVDIRDLLHEKGRLGEWMATVPPPPGLDERAAPPAEVVAAGKPPRRAGLVPRGDR
ncbi:MAG: NuoI/complex I 23 kDa subunit family protein [Phycicoccus sp.]